MYVDRPIREYLDDLGARKPAPGGGSAAALTAAIGTSLMSMVCNYTIGNSKYKAVEKTIACILEKVRVSDKRMRSLIDDDVAAYGKLVAGLKGLKAGADDAARDELYKDAAEPPFLICEISHGCLKLCVELVGCCNNNLITDMAIAAIMFEAAFFSAKFNVYSNLEHIKDIDCVAKMHKALSSIEPAVASLKEDVLEACEDAIKNNSGF